MWMALFCISLQNPYGLFPVTLGTYCLLVVYVCSLIIGISITYNKTAFKVKSTEGIQKQLDYLIENKYVLIATAICIAFLSYIYSKQSILLLTISAMELRNDGVQELLFESNPILGLFNNFFVRPCTYFIEVLAAYVLLYRRKKIIPLLLFISVVLLSAMIGGSRGVIVKIIVYAIFLSYCCPFLQGNSKKSNIKLFISLFVFGIMIFAVVAYLTAQRLYNINEFSFETILLGVDSMLIHVETYLVGPFRALDYAFKHDYFDKLGGPTLGCSTLGFIPGMLKIFLGKLGIAFTTPNNVIYGTLQNDWIWIGRDFNFAYTPLLNFYMDFGILGILIIPFLFGLVIKRYSMKLFVSMNVAYLFLVAFFFNVVFESHFGWILYHWNCFVYFIYFYFLRKFISRNYSSIVLS